MSITTFFVPLHSFFYDKFSNQNFAKSRISESEHVGLRSYKGSSGHSTRPIVYSEKEEVKESPTDTSRKYFPETFLWQLNLVSWAQTSILRVRPVVMCSVASVDFDHNVCWISLLSFDNSLSNHQCWDVCIFFGQMHCFLLTLYEIDILCLVYSNFRSNIIM